MTRIFTLAIACAALLITSGGRIHAGVLTNGTLTVTIRDDNGAIDSAVFNGVEFFKLGTAVADYGLQIGTNPSTFRLNTTTGIEEQPVTTGPTSAAGIFNDGTTILAFVREYSLVPGINVLRINTTFVNVFGNVDLSYFDTFDPDQGQPLGQGFGTFNDVVSLAGGTVGQASINSGGHQHTVIIGSLDPDVTVASGSPFAINSFGQLTAFFSNPFDANEAFADQGTHIGLRTVLSPASSRVFTVDIAFGLTLAEAQAGFTAANSAQVIPEPASIAVFALGACAAAIGSARQGPRDKKRPRPVLKR